MGQMVTSPPWANAKGFFWELSQGKIGNELEEVLIEGLSESYFIGRGGQVLWATSPEAWRGCSLSLASWEGLWRPGILL